MPPIIHYRRMPEIFAGTPCHARHIDIIFARHRYDDKLPCRAMVVPAMTRLSPKRDFGQSLLFGQAASLSDAQGLTREASRHQ